MTLVVNVLGRPLELSLPLVLATVLVSVLLFAQRLLRRDSRLPPGPPSHWLYGTRIPQPYAWRAFEKWGQTYGPVCTVWLGTKPLVVVNSYRAAADLLEKQANVTADRPRQPVGDEVFSRNKRILLVRHGDRWRRLRRALHARLQITVAKSYEELQRKLALQVLEDIIKEPDLHQEHAQVYAASLVMNLTYGKTSRTTYEDPDIKLVVENFNRLGSILRPGAYLANSFPFLQHVPGTLSEVRSWSNDEFALFQRQFETVRQQIKAGKPHPPCFASFLLEHSKEYDLSDEECYYLCGSMFGAGSDTTGSAVAIVIMAAAHFPEKQRKVQEELDRVVGRDRLPTFEDWPHLPYTWAFVRETFRWRPVSTGGFQHAVSEDVVWNGHVIPKGTAIVGNHFAIHRDPEVFPDPESFQPERFLRPAGTEDDVWRATTDKELRHFTFGFGRRVCAGQHVADRSVFINAALLMHTFRISAKNDPKTGKPVNLGEWRFTDTANSHPLPGMPVAFEVRQGAERLIREALTAI